MLIAFAPRLPPTMSMVGFDKFTWCLDIIMFLSPVKILLRIGDPVKTAFLPKLSTVSLKLQHRYFAFFAIILFASPTVRSLS